MKNFKHFLATFAILLSTVTFAKSGSFFEDRWEPISAQIEQMLSDSNLIVEEEFTVTVIFKVNAERKIEIRMIHSPNEEVNRFLKKRLEKQKLYGNSWDAQKIYELPVKIEAKR